MHLGDKEPDMSASPSVTVPRGGPSPAETLALTILGTRVSADLQLGSSWKSQGGSLYSMTDVLTGSGRDTQNNREGYRQRLKSYSHEPRAARGHGKLEAAGKDSLPSRVIRGRHLDCGLLASNTVRIDLSGFTV